MDKDGKEYHGLVLRLSPQNEVRVREQRRVFHQLSLPCSPRGQIVWIAGAASSRRAPRRRRQRASLGDSSHPN